MKPDFTKPSGLLLGLLYFFVLAILLLIVIAFNAKITGSISTYGVNKTVGWGWDILNWLPVFAIVSLLLYILGYLILFLCKATISKKLSVINLSLVLLSLFLSFFRGYDSMYMLNLLVPVLSVLVLFVNIGFAIGNSKAVKRNAA
ncbi:hypothetical protein ACLI1A_04645 [Flavobacterium sp. RHBU_3]|uniref:hypothetical protein n=1 Tax=Flavobacterium sp. RHBU_3 TaxID=3391184 RepID=UPI0039849FC7